MRKVSQHYEVKGPIAEIERAKQGEVLFYREPELPPGVYTMETVVYDAPSGKSSVRFATIEVPKPKRRQAAYEQPDPRQARREGAGEGSPRRQSAARQGFRVVSEHRRAGEQEREGGGFFFTAYPVQGRTGAAIRAGADAERQNGGADADDAARLPTRAAAFSRWAVCRSISSSPDTYELRAVVKQGCHRYSVR